jgi:hypothetical protein
MGLAVPCVDLLRSKCGPPAVEVNSSPGLKGLEAASDVDVAGAIIVPDAGHQGEFRRSCNSGASDEIHSTNHVVDS